MSYHRESWMMEKDEKLQTVPVLHMQGNALVKQKKYRDAASKYKEAVLLLKTVQSRVSEERLEERWDVGSVCVVCVNLSVCLCGAGHAK